MFSVKKLFLMTRQYPVECTVSAAGCIGGALMILVLPLPWLCAVILAATIHESCHLILLKLCGVSVHRIRIGIHGAAIETAALSPVQELLCAAAGPAGSLLCLVFAKIFPALALCALVQGVYNLLPVYPLDGGRIVRSMATLLMPRYTERICRAVSVCTVILINLICAVLYLRTALPCFLLIGGYFILTATLCRKTPCKGSSY